MCTFDPLDTVLFDLDGVITPTAEVHMLAWARLFEPFLASRDAAPYQDSDYFDYVDGKPRYEGVRSLLLSRGIEIPFGEPTDDPALDTVCGLGNRKNDVFTAVLDADGVIAYPGSVAFLDALQARGIKVAVVSSSKNARPVLTAAGLIDRFEIIVDGVVAAERGIPGKPNPDTYLDAATGDLLRAGMSADLAHYAMHAIGPRIWGYSPEGFDGPVVGAESTGELPPEEREALAERFPSVAAVVADSTARHGGCDPTSEFAFTLDLLLDGVARLHESGWASSPQRAPLVTHRYGSSGGRRAIALHGLTEAGTCWPDLIGQYPHWDIAAPDLRGHGESPRFTEDELSATPQVMLADVVELLDAQAEPVVLFGHSLGGLLALRAALARPDRVAALILEDPAKPHDGPMGEFVEQNERFLDSLATDAQRASEIERMARETGWSREEIEEWAQSKPLVDRRYIREGLAMGDGPWEEAFESLRVPTLLVLPPHAEMAPGELANPSVTRVVIDHAGHCVRRDQPHAFFAAVDGFLESIA